MAHWHPPHTRGIHNSEAYHPPYPQPASSNDLGARVARLEVHLYHATEDRRRIERESLQRAADLLHSIRSMDGRLTHSIQAMQGLRAEATAPTKALEVRLQALEQQVGTAKTIMSWAPQVLRYLGAIVLFLLLLSGRLTVENIKLFLAALGFPTG